MVATLVAVTVAVATAAPDESVTLPEIVAVIFCPYNAEMAARADTSVLKYFMNPPNEHPARMTTGEVILFQSKLELLRAPCPANAFGDCAVRSSNSKRVGGGGGN